MSAEEEAPGGLAGLRARWLALTPNHRGALWMIAAGCAFTLNGAVVKTLGQGGIPPLQMSFVRAGFSLLILLPFLWRAGFGVLATSHPGTHLIRALGGSAALICGFYALVKLPLADVTTLSFTTPLFTIVLAVPLLGEAVRWRRWTATAAGFLGVVIMARPGAGSVEPGALFAVAMALGISVATIMVKRLPPGESPISMLFWFCILSMLLTSVPALRAWQPPSPGEWLLLALVGTLGAGAQSLIIRAYMAGEATFVAPFDYSKLLLAMLIGFALFGELPDAWSLTGAAIIIGSTLYIVRREAALGHRVASGESGTP